MRQLLKLLRRVLRSELSKAKRRNHSIAAVVILTIGVFAIDYFLKEPDAPIPNPGTDWLCEPRQVYDGDTATVACEQGKLKVRVWGIDAPERGQKPWGDEAQEFLQYLIGSKPLQVQVVDKDRYGRAVARLFSDGQDLGLTMVREGKAVVYQQYNKSNTYRQAQQQARHEALGVWSEPGSQQDPAAWRKLNPRN